MQLTAQAIAQIVNGFVDGNPDVTITGPSKIEATIPNTISFYANSKFENYLYEAQAAAIIVPKDFEPKSSIKSTLIRVDDVYTAVAILFEQFSRKAMPKKIISKNAFVDDGAILSENVGIGHFSVVENGVRIGDNTVLGTNVFVGEDVEIGKNVVIYSGVKIYHGCKIGDHCIIHSNVVIGSDGFGFAPQKDGSYKKIHQLGIVIIEENVEIGSNTTIDRGMMEPTIIRKGVKLDNLIQIAHNVVVGENTVVAAQAGIAGSAKLGKNIQVGGQTAIVGHITVADGAKIQGNSGVASSIKKPNTNWWGSPAIPYMTYLRASIKFKDLPEMDRRLRALEKRMDDDK